MCADHRTTEHLITRLFPFLAFIPILIFNACENNPGALTLGEEFIESQTAYNVIDTLSVNLSTVLLDTVETSGTGSLLVGNYRDDVFGKITSHGYLQLGLPSYFDVENDDTYDSLKLVIRYNGYTFGDTTQMQKISVHQLTENIAYTYNDMITSGSFFNYDPDPLGSLMYIPKPNSSEDSLAIPISDDMGLDLFTKLRDGSDVMEDEESFKNHFHGLVLLADETYDGSIIGFNAGEEDVKLILYTSREGITTEDIRHAFKLKDISRQFNHISADFSSTPFNTLTEQRFSLTSAATDGLAFLQGGIGLAIRVDFPTLQEILLAERGAILEARLSIAPLKNSYDDFDLPPDLIVYESDDMNRMLTSYGAVAASALTIDDQYDEKTAYEFNITNYINYEMADSYVDPEKGFLITLPAADQNTSFSRLVANAQNQNTNLKIYYLSY